MDKRRFAIFFTFGLSIAGCLALECATGAARAQRSRSVFADNSPECQIPKETVTKLSLVLQAHSAWLSDAGLQPIVADDANLSVDQASPVAEKQRELRTLVQRLLGPSLQPDDWQSAYRVDEDGNLYFHAGESDRFVKGLAMVDQIGDSMCFSFMLHYRKPVRAANAATLAAAIRDALPEKIADAVIPKSGVLIPTPGVNGPREFATVVILGPDRIGMLWDHLYLYESKDCVIGVFQSATQRAAQADPK